MAAMAALSILMLIKTDCFSNMFFSICFGAVSGLGMLTKWPFFIFVLPWIGVSILKNIKKIRSQKIIKNMFLFLIIISVLFLSGCNITISNEVQQEEIKEKAVETEDVIGEPIVEAEHVQLTEKKEKVEDKAVIEVER